MKKIELDFKIPKSLENDIENYVNTLREYPFMKGILIDDLFISIEDAVDLKQITYEQGMILSNYYIDGRKIRVYRR